VLGCCVERRRKKEQIRGLRLVVSLDECFRKEDCKMKISDAIEQLTEWKKEYGDVELLIPLCPRCNSWDYSVAEIGVESVTREQVEDAGSDPDSPVNKFPAGEFVAVVIS